MYYLFVYIGLSVMFECLLFVSGRLGFGEKGVSG